MRSSSNKESRQLRLQKIDLLRESLRGWSPRYMLGWTPCYIFHKIKAILYDWSHFDQPWLTAEANSILLTLLKPTDVGFEWGSGRSTIWFAQRIKHLTSIEHDEQWYTAVKDKLAIANISNVNYRLCKLTSGYGKPEEFSYVQAISSFDKNSLDFVLADGRYRDICANLALEKIRPGGILVVDDANRYLPWNSRSPNLRSKDSTPASELWANFLDCVKDWRLIWTSNGVKDTAIWFKVP